MDGPPIIAARVAYSSSYKVRSQHRIRRDRFVGQMLVIHRYHDGTILRILSYQKKDHFHLIDHRIHFLLAERYRPGYGCKGVACDVECKQFPKFQGLLYFYDFNLYTRFLFPPSVETVPSSTISPRIRLALASFTPSIDAISAHFANA